MADFENCVNFEALLVSILYLQDNWVTLQKIKNSAYSEFLLTNLPNDFRINF